MNYRNRIVGHRDVPVAELKPHPLNWRTHPETQQATLRASLEEVGVALTCSPKPGPRGMRVSDP